MDTSTLIKTYLDIGHLAFGYKGRAIVSILIYLELYLLVVEFLILEGDNLEKLFLHAHLKLAGLIIGGKQCFVLLTALVVLPTIWMRNMGRMAYVSSSGVLASVVSVVCILWIGAVGDVGFHEKGTALSWGGMSTAVSLFVFCYGGHSVFPTLCSSMKDMSQFPKVLLVCFITSTVTYGSVVILGYMMYRQMLHSQVTLNLPVNNLSTKITIYITLLSPLTKYALAMTPVAIAVEGISPLYNTRLVSILIRSVILASTVIMALTIPFFGSLMAFVGAFLCVVVSMVLPCVCYLKINRASRSFRLQLVTIVAILLVAFVVAVVGTCTSLKQIIRNL